MEKIELKFWGAKKVENKKAVSSEEYLEVGEEKFDRKDVSFCICVIVQIAVQMLWYRGQACWVLCIQLHII